MDECKQAFHIDSKNEEARELFTKAIESAKDELPRIKGKRNVSTFTFVFFIFLVTGFITVSQCYVWFATPEHERYKARYKAEHNLEEYIKEVHVKVGEKGLKGIFEINDYATIPFVYMIYYYKITFLINVLLFLLLLILLRNILKYRKKKKDFKRIIKQRLSES